MKTQRIIPAQQSGASSDTSYTVELANDQEAEKVFLHARDNLLHINRWHTLSGNGTAQFQLTDERGNNVDRAVQKGDFVKINIPGPSNANSKYDWVHVEEVEQQLRHNFHVWTAVKVRPASSPNNAETSTSHFFSQQATSSFIVERRGTLVRASVVGRNEKMNEQSHGLLDTVRNAVVAVAAMVGFNKPQWKSLVKGLIQDAPQVKT